MTERKNFFRNVLDAMVDSRMRQAEREMRQYRDVYDFRSTEAKR